MRRWKKGGERAEPKSIDRFFFLVAAAAARPLEGRRASSRKNRPQKHARRFKAAPRGLSSPTPRVCGEEGAPSRGSERTEAHEGRTKEKKGQGVLGCFCRKRSRRRAPFFFLESKQAAAEEEGSSSSIHQVSRSPQPFSLTTASSSRPRESRRPPGRPRRGA